MTPEEQLVLRCARSIITNEPVGEPPTLDWEQVLHLAEVNRLAPIVSSALSIHALPEEWAERLENSARRSRMRTAVMIEEFQLIHAQLMITGIPIIPIKGIAISQQVYPSPSMRYYDDLDLLVPSADGQGAIMVLEKMGYEAHPNAPRPEWHHLTPHIHRKRGTMVEIHVDLIRRSGQGWPIDDIWNRSKSAILGEVSTTLLSDEDSLILTVLHARHNLFNRLVYMLDSSLMTAAASNDGQYWNTVSTLGEEAGAICALGYTLQTAERLFGSESLADLECSRSRISVANRIASWDSLEPKRSSLRQEPLSRMVEVLLMDSLGASISMAARLLFPPRSFMASESENQRVSFRHYLKRINRSARRAYRQLRK